MKKPLSKIILFTLLTMFSLQGKCQQTDLQDAGTVKALFIYNFTKYIEWPAARPGTPFIIQVYGDAAMKQQLETMLKGRKVNDRPIVVRLYSAGDTTQAQINFIPGRQYDHARPLLSRNNKGSLFITDGLATKRNEGINLIKVDDRLRFQLNESALRKEGLKISSQLLELALTEEEL